MATKNFAVETDSIPGKLYFKIGEVSKLTKIKPYVLRYWESEFKIIAPFKSKGNQRVYKRSDVETVLYIKRLLNDEKLTLEGAKKKVKEFRKSEAKETESKQLSLPLDDKRYAAALESIRQDLASIKNLLSRG